MVGTVDDGLVIGVGVVCFGVVVVACCGTVGTGVCTVATEAGMYGFCVVVVADGGGVGRVTSGLVVVVVIMMMPGPRVVVVVDCVFAASVVVGVDCVVKAGFVDGVAADGGRYGFGVLTMSGTTEPGIWELVVVYCMSERVVVEKIGLVSGVVVTGKITCGVWVVANDGVFCVDAVGLVVPTGFGFVTSETGRYGLGVLTVSGTTEPGI